MGLIEELEVWSGPADCGLLMGNGPCIPLSPGSVLTEELKGCNGKYAIQQVMFEISQTIFVEWHGSQAGR
ncbi:hypothetical protein ColLi_07516 [Colletotrichum liriopes]|uniref:Uncharacterized protein n=1 Tax=Colletotrichum liriopes TaxID=708192 RepID=A0AA37GP79_9PEZI|nr:hypothetical protein ColLi_07516 [Colletotrichum liriopes]